MTYKNTDWYMRLMTSVAASILTLIIVGYLTGFMTRAEYKPESFLTKEKYNKDQLDYVKEKTTIKSELGHLKTGQTEIKTSLKELIQRVK